jgi:hypothetical protein
VATTSDAVVNVAVVTPSVVLSVPDPRVVEPSSNVTVPVGVPAPGLETATVAVNVSDWPITGEGTEAATDVVVGSWPTVNVNAVDVLVRSIESPP